MRKKLMIMICLLTVLSMQAQTVEKQIRKGNRQYRKGNYTEAEVQYRKVLEDKPICADADSLCCDSRQADSLCNLD